MIIVRRLAAAALAAFFFVGFSTAPIAAAGVNIVVNGATVTFDQPPIERAGRVFVPLRGVFERLGATVVYANGDINAQGNGRGVHLHIGSTQATVNGQTLYMDVAPFLVGARTLVPLRFVAQALGASVNWDASNSTVYIQGGGSAYMPPSNASFSLTNRHPATSVGNTSPQISAAFSEPVNRDALRVYVDGNNVTALTLSNSNSFSVVPNFTLSSGTHAVRVTGTTQSGANFDTGWSFTTSGSAAANVINNVSPASGSTVGSSFTLSGHTRPGSAVHIAAEATASAFGIFQVGTGTFQTDVTADGNGDFSVPVNVNTASGGTVRVLITSTSTSGVAVSRNLTYHAG